MSLLSFVEIKLIHEITIGITDNSLKNNHSHLN